MIDAICWGGKAAGNLNAGFLGGNGGGTEFGGGIRTLFTQFEQGERGNGGGGSDGGGGDVGNAFDSDTLCCSGGKVSFVSMPKVLKLRLNQ